MVTREQIEKLFGHFGSIIGVSLHSGYGFVQYGTEPEARNAISFTDGTSIGGKLVGKDASARIF